MSNGATDATKSANSDYTGWETGTLGNYQNDINNFTSNVNSELSQGNPYLTQAYKTAQNIQTSGAMNAANTKAAQQTRDAALRTGTNTAGVAAQTAENARAGQRQQDTYDASRDTENEDKWLQQEDTLTGQQLQGANSEAGMFNTEEAGRSNSLTNLSTLQGDEDKLWGSAIGAAGSAAGGAFGGKKV